jgi:hypothetical protein
MRAGEAEARRLNSAAAATDSATNATNSAATDAALALAASMHSASEEQAKLLLQRKAEVQPLPSSTHDSAHRSPLTAALVCFQLARVLRTVPSERMFMEESARSPTPLYSKYDQAVCSCACYASPSSFCVLKKVVFAGRANARHRRATAQRHAHQEA